MRRTVASLILGALALLTSGAADAQPGASVLYLLGPQSQFEVGCFGPCLCPVLSAPLRGTFSLTHVGFDGLYENYELSNVQWTVPDSTTNLTIRGSGKYRVGGEFALQQEMSLDVSVGGGPIQHFESGLVPGGGGFPKILIDVSLHRRQACIDTVMHVEAAPDPPSSVDEGSVGKSSRLERLAPNPFSGKTDIHLTVGLPGAVELAVYDSAGRLVRNLVKGAWLPTGAYAIPWDGLREGGSRCATGVYFITARIAGSRLSTRRIVKIE